jgi:hypothetical protein
MRCGLVLAVAAACHNSKALRTPPHAKPAAVADSVPALICPPDPHPSTLHNVDPLKGGYRVLADDAAVDALRLEMEKGTPVQSAEQKSLSLRALWAAFDDSRADIKACMVHADGANPATQYSIRISVSGNSVATLLTNVSVERIDGVNTDHSAVLAKTEAEPCVHHLLERLELPPGDWAAESSMIVRQDFCIPTLEIALRSTQSYVDSYMTWWRSHREQTCPTSLAELSSYGANNGLDPWHQPYVMRCNASGFQVLSAGPDRTLGTADDLETHR